MPGEHWCSICEKDVSKHKDSYVKLYYHNFDEKKKRIVNIVCPDCREKDEGLDESIYLLEHNSQPYDQLKGTPKCSFCGERVKKKEKYIRADFRFEGKEHQTRICEACRKKKVYAPTLKSLKPRKQNPVFKLDVICKSVSICDSFKKPRKDRGINCGNICANIDGELYCRKAHPGTVKMYRERWALPPNRRQLMGMLKDMQPIFKQMSEQAKLVLDKREEFYKEIENTESPTIAIRRVPDNYKYEIIEFPIEDNQITVPWNASVLKLNLKTATVLVPKE